MSTSNPSWNDNTASLGATVNEEPKAAKAEKPLENDMDAKNDDDDFDITDYPPQKDDDAIKKVDPLPRVEEDPLTDYTHPYDRGLICRRVCCMCSHVWQIPLLRKGANEPLQEGHIYNVPKADGLELLVEQLETQLDLQKQRGEPFSLWKAVFRRELYQISILFMNQLFTMGYNLFQPLVIRELTLFYANQGGQSQMEGIIWASVLAFTSLAKTLHTTMVFITFARVMNRIRSSLMHYIFKKALRMSQHAKQASSTGKIVNLMAQDCEKLGLGVVFGPILILNFLLLFGALGLLVWQVGLPGLIGWAFLILTAPFQGIIGKNIAQAKRAMLSAADDRVKFINELLMGIRVTKLYAWELPLLKIVSEFRTKELAALLKKMLFFGLMNGFNLSIPPFVALLILGTYVLMGNTLTVATTFTVLSLLQSMRFAIGFLPFAIMMVLDARVSLQRLQSYFEGADIQDRMVQDDDVPVRMENATFQWNPEEETTGESVAMGRVKSASPGLAQDLLDDKAKQATEEHHADDVQLDVDGSRPTSKSTSRGMTGPVLHGLNLVIPPGSLTAIVGSVGAGKSSLLSAILGEMTVVEGSCNLNGRVAYTAQTPFVINATLRENITFGLPFDRKKYKRCVKAAALLPDLKILPKADFTEIGERGINLSGGQKARISLARALYRHDQVDLFLFDDPLSAVDMEVGDKMFRDGVMDVAGNENKNARLIIMNSHLHLLQECDSVIIMERGCIVAHGPYLELVEMYPNLLQNDLDKRKAEGDESVSAESGLLEPRLHTSFTFMEEQRDVIEDEKGFLMIEEDREVGNVKLAVYGKYFSAAVEADIDLDEIHLLSNQQRTSGSNLKGICLGISVILLYVLAQFFQSASDIWLAWFSEENQIKRFPSRGLPFWLSIWASFVVGVGVLGVVTTYMFGRVAIRSSRNVHLRALYSVLRAPMRFFDATPIGRIINRFSKDTEQMDDALPSGLASLLNNTLTLLAAIVIMCVTVPYVLILLFPLCYVFWLMQKFFRASSRELKRIEGISRSPIFAQFSETLNGMDTIRAFGVADSYIEKNLQLIGLNSKLFLQFQLAQRWLAVNLDFLTILILYSIALFGVFLRGTPGYEPSMMALAVIYAISLTGMLQWTVRTSVEVENSLTSVERLSHYTEIESESDEVTPSAFLKSFDVNDWPKEGKIVFDDLQLRYRSDLDLVLRGIDAEIQSCEKIGICGRTGAGKSSLMIALFRMVEPERPGSIVIDGVDTSKLGLRDLRSNLSIIPQDPVLFSGTLRFNLDPFEQHPDEDLWTVLKKVHLYETINENEEKLLTNVAEGGENFSVGQRQLICIGRALLRKSKIMLLDEATASIDNETDALIQKTIRENFEDRTVLTIAHRLDTIMDSDRIMVLAEGRIIEFDTPERLQMIPDGVFKSMVETGK